MTDAEVVASVLAVVLGEVDAGGEIFGELQSKKDVRDWLRGWGEDTYDDLVEPDDFNLRERRRVGRVVADSLTDRVREIAARYK